MRTESVQNVETTLAKFVFGVPCNALTVCVDYCIFFCSDSPTSDKLAMVSLSCFTGVTLPLL